MLVHNTNASVALLNSLTENSGADAIKVYEVNGGSTAVTKVFSLQPANNLNFTIIGQALATVKSEDGIALDTATLKASPGQKLSPIEKTLSNCILGSYIASAGADMAVTALSAIDPATMLGDMDPQTQLTDVITKMAGSYGSIQEARESFATYDQYLTLMPVIVNCFAIVLIILTSLGVVLGFINLTTIGSTLICWSTCLSGLCLVLS